MTTTTTAAPDEVDHQAHIGHRPWQEADRHVIARDRREEGLEEVAAAEADEAEAAMGTGRGHIQDPGAGHHAAVLRGRRTAGLHRGHHRRGEEDIAGASHHRGEAEVVEAVEVAVEAEVEADEVRVTIRTAAKVRETVAGVGVVDRDLVERNRESEHRGDRSLASPP
jgi:siderophore synthetase component